MPDETPTPAVTFTHPDLPDITFEVTRGSGGQAGLPSNWISIVGTRPAEDPDHDPIIVCQAGFAGP